jgi:hypothetical protein
MCWDSPLLENSAIPGRICVRKKLFAWLARAELRIGILPSGVARLLAVLACGDAMQESESVGYKQKHAENRETSDLQYVSHDAPYLSPIGVVQPVRGGRARILVLLGANRCSLRPLG